jgi:hypothetical protein
MQRGVIDRLVLRLFDEHEARGSSGFEASWRGLLQAWNLLQFHHDTRVFSSELIPEGGDTIDHDLASQVAETPDAQSSGFGRDPDFEALLELATAEARPLVNAAYLAGLQWPEMSYEMPAANGCGPEADLAWPAVQLAILASSQLEDAPAFETAGWMVLVHPVDPDDLVKTLTEREG